MLFENETLGLTHPITTTCAVAEQGLRMTRVWQRSPQMVVQASGLHVRPVRPEQQHPTFHAINLIVLGMVAVALTLLPHS